MPFLFKGGVILCLLLCASLAMAQPTPVLIGQGQNSNITVTSSNNQSNTHPRNTLSNEGFLPNDNAAARFLQQATFGATYEEILEMGGESFETWIDQQFATSRKFNCVEKVHEHRDYKNVHANNPSFLGALPVYWEYALFEYTMTSEDLLRQRIALALSEIFVISRFSDFGDSPYAFASFYDILLDHSFGNFRDLLEAVTFHSGMGRYLTYINNPKQDTVYRIDGTSMPPDTLSQQILFPDENYAREIMQLFTIGLEELNIDGTAKLNENGQPIPTYDNVDIAELSKVFTGLTWSQAACDFGCYTTEYQPLYYQPMVMNNEYHEPSSKTLLNGHVISARAPLDGLADINDALDHLFNHPNVGPFIGKLLIQRLVTSNPSPAYVERVTKAFNGESHYGAVRGDMEAVIKAILLDDEARNCANQYQEHAGKLREPMIRYLQLCRSFKASSPNNVYRNALEDLTRYTGQKPFNAFSVFNFFQSDYQPAGPIANENLVAPEFQITSSETIAGYMNALNRWLIFGIIGEDWGYGFGVDPKPGDNLSLNFSTEMPLATNQNLPELIDRLDLILAHGQLSERTKDIVIQVIQKISDTDDQNVQSNDFKRRRVQMAIYLIMASPDYLISR